MNDPARCAGQSAAASIRATRQGSRRATCKATVCILPREYAEEFALFCERNPSPAPSSPLRSRGKRNCPRSVKTSTSATACRATAVFRDGERVAEVGDIRALWREDLVAFVLGCSFSFEQALLEAGLRLRYVEEGKNVPMYRTSIDNRARRPLPR